MSESDQQHRAYASKTKLGPSSNSEFASFHALQEALSHLMTLIHYNANKTLWIDLDLFKEFGFGVIAFHTVRRNVLLERKWPFSILM